MPKFKFFDVFELLPGIPITLTPRRKIHVNGFTFGPGVKLREGTVFGGVDFTKHIGKDLLAESHGKTLFITGVYRDATLPWCQRLGNYVKSRWQARMALEK
jgi:hypothetical protein